MKKLYLVRKNSFQYIGPCDIDDLRQSYKKMEFATGDEISGNIGPWVFLEDLDRLKRYYPEILYIMGHELEKNWDFVEVEKPSPTKKNRSIKRNKPSYVGILMLAVFSVVAAAGLIFIKNDKNMYKKFSMVLNKNVKVMKQLVESKQNDEFVKFVENNRKTITSNINNERIGFESELKYFRHYFFMTGLLPGEVSLRNLSGKIQFNSKIKCDRAKINLFLKGLLNSKGFIEGTSLHKPNPLLQVFMWDSQWINRRNYGDWIEGKNLYGACLRVVADALIAVDELGIEFNDDFEKNDHLKLVSILLERVNVMLGNSEYVQREIQTVHSPLLVMNCIESAQSEIDATECDSLAESFSAEWKDELKKLVPLRYFGSIFWTEGYNEKLMDEWTASIFAPLINGQSYQLESMFLKSVQKNQGQRIQPSQWERFFKASLDQK